MLALSAFLPKVGVNMSCRSGELLQLRRRWPRGTLDPPLCEHGLPEQELVVVGVVAGAVEHELWVVKIKIALSVRLPA